MAAIIDIKSIKVKGAEYLFHWLPRVYSEHGDEAEALCDGAGRQILLNRASLKRSMPDKRSKELLEIHALKTIMHELFHAVNHETGIVQGLDHDIAEIICEAYASFIVDTFELKIK